MSKIKNLFKKKATQEEVTKQAADKVRKKLEAGEEVRYAVHYTDGVVIDIRLHTVAEACKVFGLFVYDPRIDHFELDI